jgi:type I restriction enzyme S subunit
LSGKQFVEDGYPAYGAGGLNGYLATSEFEEPGIVLSSIGARCGKCFLAERAWTSLANTQIIFPDPTKADIRFLWYQLDDEARWPRSGAAQPFIRPSDVKNHLVSLPPLDEQRRIVAVLDEALEAIATVTANAEKNLANARELFSSELRHLFRVSGKGWRWKPIGEIADARLGKMLDKSKNKGSPKPYLRNLNVRWFRFDLSDLLEMRFEETEHDRYTAKRGDLLIVEGGHPGRAAIWESDEPIFFQKAVHRVRFVDPLLAKLLMYMLFAQNGDGTLSKYFSGTGIQHLTGQSLARIPMPVPPQSERGPMIAKIEALLSISEEAERLYLAKLSELNAFKQSLLRRAFSGELTDRQPLAA